jgi:hypothetical protein
MAGQSNHMGRNKSTTEELAQGLEEDDDEWEDIARCHRKAYT